MRKGNHVKQSFGEKSEWEVISPKKSINFANVTSPTNVCDCKIVLNKDEVVTIIISNAGNQSNGGSFIFFFIFLFIYFNFFLFMK